MSKRLVYNGVHRYPRKPFSHISCSYGTAIVEGLRQRGHDIEQWNFGRVVVDQMPAAEGNGGSPRRTPTADAYDGVIISEVSQLALWQRVVPDWDWARKFSLLWYHGDASDSARQHAQLACTRIAATCPEVLAAWVQATGNAGDPFLLQMLPMWQYWQPPGDSPYPSGPLPTYLWVGRIGPRAMEMLLAVTQKLPASQFHLIHTPPSPAWQTGEQLTDGASELLSRGVHVHPTRSHGTFSEYFWFATVGLDVLAHGDQATTRPAMNCKVVDYVTAGLPIVGERGTPGDWLYRDRKWCRQVAMGDWDAYAAAIVELSEQPQNRQANQQEIRQQFDFEQSLDVLSGELRQHGF